jgi:hypothetical protein
MRYEKVDTKKATIFIVAAVSGVVLLFDAAGAEGAPQTVDVATII